MTSPALIRAVAEAILGTLVAPGVPPIVTALDLLTEKNRAKVLEQAVAAIRAYEEWVKVNHEKK